MVLLFSCNSGETDKNEKQKPGQELKSVEKNNPVSDIKKIDIKAQEELKEPKLDKFKMELFGEYSLADFVKNKEKTAEIQG